jgi:signal transduction histidine kinase
MTLRARLFALVSGVVALTVALVTWTVSTSARRAFEALERQRTAALLTQIRGEFDRQGDDVVRRVERVVAGDSFQRTALDIARHAGDYGAFVNEAASLAATQGLDILDLVAADGTVVSSAEWPARFGYRHSWVASRVGTAAFLQPLELPHETALTLVVVRPANGGPHAVLVAGGRRLDESFLKSLALPDGTRAWLYRNLEPEVARQQLIDAAGPAAQAAQLEPLIARVRQSGREAVESIEWPDGPEVVDAIPLAGPSGAVLGVLLVGSSGRDRAALVQRIVWSGVAFGAGGIVLGLALSYVLSARVTRPIEQLAGAAREIADGHWEARPRVEGASGEVARLADAFESMTRELADQRERLVQVERVAAWRELARRLAHELKNPLFPLRLTIDNLRRARQLPRAEFDEVLDESLTTLDSGLANLNGVVGRFSDFSRMPAPVFESTDANAIVDRTASLFRAQLESANRPRITVTLDLDPASPAIRADPEQLGRVVQNLLLNAIDAMPRGGELTIRTRRDGSQLRLTVADTGDGLTAEECTRLFTPYYTTKQHGTGLGLAIVQAVVADHHGRIWVESAPGRGATFQIELPLEQASA